MSLYKFDEFTFDSMTYQLMYRGRSVALRPKAQKLLHLLIRNRERVVTKSEIMSAVWDSRYAREHLLFQLVSELRKPPLRMEFVRTQPNEGYQWTVPTKVMQRHVFAPRMVAGTMLASSALGLMLWFTLAGTTPSETSAVQAVMTDSVRLPAHRAFSKGVVALEREDNELAAEWFQYALTENPESVESSLFLAETLLKQNKTVESSEQLQALLEKPSLDAYSKMTATNLMSRVHQHEGNLYEALRYARESGQADVIAQCSVDMVEQRIEMLEGELGMPLAVSELKPDEKNSAAAQPNDNKDKSSGAHKYETQCGQLSTEPKGTTYCEPDDANTYYVNIPLHKTTNIS